MGHALATNRIFQRSLGENTSFQFHLKFQRRETINNWRTPLTSENTELYFSRKETESPITENVEPTTRLLTILFHFYHAF